MVDHIHKFEERRATAALPYHFVESGLPNAYLAGVKYRVCAICGKQSADIPAIEELMQSLACGVVRTTTPLTGADIRFLRKRMSLKSSRFASLLGVTPEQVSRWENGYNSPAPSADKLMRLLYCIKSGDPDVCDILHDEIEGWLSSLEGTGTSPDIHAKLRNKVWKIELVAPCSPS